MRGTLAHCALAVLAAGGTLFSTGAFAQSFTTRTITTEPVETIVTQTPTGTIVTRRPVQDVLPGVVPVVPGVAPPTAVVETVPNTVDAITTREVVRRRDAVEARRDAVAAHRAERRRDAAERRMITREVAAHPATRRTTTRTVRAAPRLVLTEGERRIIYRTIAEREVVPSRAVVPAQPYMAPLQAPLVEAPIVAADEDAEIYAVGSVLPANVPLFAMPQNVALSVPVTQPYSYAWLGGRAYLVNPRNGVIVADLSD
jgi:hypothetical protein